uniref:ubiquitinyl hydrolase 1 n=1 Tax=Labrus bergylta TaxID=56723 RepID=A0A3Q3E7B6_9LABR
MDGETDESPEEQLAKQHRKEKKDLQAKIQSMKNAMTDEIAKLEADLNQKHEEELSLLNSTGDTKVNISVLNGVENLQMDDGEKEDVTQGRVTKAQKRREKKAAQEKERESRIAEAEVLNLQGVRHQEGLMLAQKLALQQLQIKEISSDGHCMYRAIEDQLPEIVMSVKDLRSRTAEHMRSHADDFLPFLTKPNTGDMYTREEFEHYCSEVEHTAAWGGQLELQALTQVLRLPIEVIQANSSAIKIGEEFDSDPITLVYMRHAYGLGEHYNSVERLKEPANAEDS